MVYNQKYGGHTTSCQNLGRSTALCSILLLKKFVIDFNICCVFFRTVNFMVLFDFIIKIHLEMVNMRPSVSEFPIQLLLLMLLKHCQRSFVLTCAC